MKGWEFRTGVGKWWPCECSDGVEIRDSPFRHSYTGEHAPEPAKDRLIGPRDRVAIAVLQVLDSLRDPATRHHEVEFRHEGKVIGTVAGYKTSDGGRHLVVRTSPSPFWDSGPDYGGERA